MKANHWASRKERGNLFFLRLSAWMVYRLPTWMIKPVVYLVVIYFYVTSPAERRNIRRYQHRLTNTYPHVVLPRRFAVLHQFIAFGESICDRFAVWQQKIRFEDLQVSDPSRRSRAMMDSGGKHTARGEIFISSHLGNAEISRALMDSHPGAILNVLVHSRHAETFNRALKQIGADDIRLVQVTDLDAALMMKLHAGLDAGEWMAIAADRTPVRGEKMIEVDFLGDKARLPQGPWLLAMLLRAPLNTLFCSKENGCYHLKVTPFRGVIEPGRNKRREVVQELVQQYADVLAAECAQNPLQWFNFYDFWNDDGA